MRLSPLFSVALAYVAFAVFYNLSAGEVSGITDLRDEPIQPLVAASKLDPRRVELGRKLFGDTRLSHNNMISCATCHNLEAGGTAHTVFSLPGVSSKTVPINIPTVIGSGLNFVQFWDGRADTLEKQLDGPTQHPDEMASSWPEIVDKLRQDKAYTASFRDIYGGPPSPDGIKDAISTFERSLVYADSPFDRYLRGDGAAISPSAKHGYQMFKDFGCAACHQGHNVGGNMFQKFGIVDDYFAKRGHIIPQDYGRFNVTHDENDRYVFRVPSLRNVALTAPYFHDGSAATLDQAVKTMATYQLGHPLTPSETSDIVEFLRSLTGKPQPAAGP